MISAFWRWLTTSRYTRSLEVRVDELKAENAELKRENVAMCAQLYPQVARALARKDGEPVAEYPRSFNWAQR